MILCKNIFLRFRIKIDTDIFKTRRYRKTIKIKLKNLFIYV